MFHYALISCFQELGLLVCFKSRLIWGIFNTCGWSPWSGIISLQGLLTRIWNDLSEMDKPVSAAALCISNASQKAFHNFHFPLVTERFPQSANYWIQQYDTALWATNFFWWASITHFNFILKTFCTKKYKAVISQ